jgi:multiple sugar transport system permease protein/putative aldouronate transport system permease protein
MRVKWTGEEKVFQLVGYVFFGVILLLCAYPFYYLLISTISNNQQVALGQITIVPVGIHFDNYVTILRVQNLGHSAFISLCRVLMGTCLTLFCTSYTAYFFTKNEMWGKTFWYRITVVTMYFSAGLIPSYLNNRMLGLTNTFFIYVIPGLVSVYNMILIKTSMEAMPPSLEESAYVDGAGYFRRFIQIVLPLQTPILATVALFSAVGHWNDFFTTKLYITNTQLYTLQYVLYEMLQQVQAAADQMNQASGMDRYETTTPISIRLTLTVVVVFPVMCVYPFIQRYYVKGIMIGAVKG